MPFKCENYISDQLVLYERLCEIKTTSPLNSLLEILTSLFYIIPGQLLYRSDIYSQLQGNLALAL